MPQGTALKQFNYPKTALSKITRRSYLTIYQNLLETVKIIEPF